MCLSLLTIGVLYVYVCLIWVMIMDCDEFACFHSVKYIIILVLFKAGVSSSQNND